MSELIAFYLRRTGVRIRVHRSGISTNNRIRIEEELLKSDIKIKDGDEIQNEDEMGK